MDPEIIARLLAGQTQHGQDHPILGRVPASAPIDPLHALGGIMAPHLTEYLTQPRPPIPPLPERPGKAPSTSDPRLPGVVSDLGALATLPLAAAAPEAALAARAAPVAERVAPALGRAAARLPEVDSRLLATQAAGATAFEPSSAEAAPRLTRDQQRQVEMERLRGEQETRRAQAEREGQFRTEQDRARFQAQQAEEQRTSAARFEAQQKEAEANAPFRQKYPMLASALPFMGSAAAFLSPFLTRALVTNPGAHALAREWSAAADATEAALAAGNRRGAVQGLRQLEGYAKQWEQRQKGIGAIGLATSAALPTEAALLPSEYDAAMLPPGNPSREAAMHVLTSPTELGARALPGLLQGLPAAMLGNKLPAGPLPLAPAGRSAGLVNAYDIKGPMSPDSIRKALAAPRKPRTRIKAGEEQ